MGSTFVIFKKMPPFFGFNSAYNQGNFIVSQRFSAVQCGNGIAPFLFGYGQTAEKVQKRKRSELLNGEWIWYTQNSKRAIP
jgi:hypothetical protein